MQRNRLTCFVMLSALATLAWAQPTVVFEENFNAYADGESPSSIVELRNTHFRYGEVIGGRYAVHHGHRHVPVMPRVADFDWRFTVEPHPRTLRTPDLRLEFRTGITAHRGYRIEHRFGAENRLVLTYAGKALAIPAPPALDLPVAEPVRFRLRAEGDRIRFERNGESLIDINHAADGSRDAGNLAFSAQYFHGRQDVVSPLFFDDFHITTTDPGKDGIRRYARDFEIPRDVRAGHWLLHHRVEIDEIPDTGLDAIRADLPGGRIFRIRLHINWPDMSLDRGVLRYRDMAARTPYVRLEHPDGAPWITQRIFNGILGGMLPGRGGGIAQLLRIRTEYDPSIHYGVALRDMKAADATGPQQVTAYVDKLPDDFRIVAGWEFFLDRDHTESAGPVEAIFLSDGTLLHAGDPLPRDARALQLASPESAGILDRIAMDNPLREEFRQRLVRNPYFLEDEPVHFSVRQRLGPDTTPFHHVSWQLLDAYRRPLHTGEPVPFLEVDPADPVASALSRAGRRCLETERFAVPATAPGVYWLDIDVGNRIQRHAFSIVPRDHRPGNSAARASGLPWVHGQFFPTQPWNKDAGHYVTRTGTRSVHWTELLHALNLEAMWDQRLPIDDENMRVIQGIWASSVTPRSYRLLEAQEPVDPIPYAGYRLWRDVYNPWGGAYNEEAVAHFLRSDGYTPHPGDSVLHDNTAADAMRWQQILDHHFKNWIDFWCELYAATNDARRRDLDAIRPGLTNMAYGPPLINSLYYGSLYCAKYYGYDWKRIVGRRQLIDIYQMETYVHDFGRHPASYSPSIALTRMTFPWMGTAWEIYGAQGYVVDSRTQEGRAPHGLGYPSANFMAHQTAELSLGPWYLDAEGIHPAGMSHVAPNFGAFTQEMLIGMIAGWRAAADARALRPVRGATFVRSYAAAEADPSWNRPEITNAAAEAPAYAYLQWRLAGLPGGVFVDVAHLDHVTPVSTDVLVLPSMRGATAAQIASIRRLHAQGVALVCFDDATGLEDLFGIRRRTEGLPIHAVQAAADTPWLSELAPEIMRERVPHRGTVWYTPEGAETLLVGLDDAHAPIAPLLTLYQAPDQPGAVFFAQGATDVGRRRDPLFAHQIEGEISSLLVQHALRQALRAIARPAIAVSEPGTILAFERDDGALSVILCEASFPFGEGRPSAVRLTLHSPTAAQAVLRGRPPDADEINENIRHLEIRLEPDEVVPWIIENFTP